MGVGLLHRNQSTHVRTIPIYVGYTKQSIAIGFLGLFQNMSRVTTYIAADELHKDLGDILVLRWAS